MKIPGKFLWVTAILLLQALSPVNASHNYTISTNHSWNGKDSTYPLAFGKTGVSTFGETFTAPLSQFLGVVFWMHSDWPDWTAAAEVEVYQWVGPLVGSGGHADGEPLFKSPISLNIHDFQFSRVEVMFPDPVILTPGNHYIALMTISEPADYELSQGSGTWGITKPSPANFDWEAMNDGGFQWQNTGNDPTRLTTDPWDTLDNYGSLAWTGYFPGIGIPEIDGLSGGSALTFVFTALALISERRNRFAS